MRSTMKEEEVLRAQELCKSQGSRPGHPLRHKPYGFGGPEAPWKNKEEV